MVKSLLIPIVLVRAAFYPVSDETPHPILSGGVDQLTMFADYRVRLCLFVLDDCDSDLALDIVSGPTNTPSPRHNHI